MKEQNHLEEPVSSQKLRIIDSNIDEASGSHYCRQHWWLRKWIEGNSLNLVNQIINRYLFLGQHQKAISMNHIKDVHLQTALGRIIRGQLYHRSLLRKLTQYLLPLFLYINLFILLTSSQILYARNENINGTSNNNDHNDHQHHANCNHRLPYKLPQQQQQQHQQQYQLQHRQHQFNSKPNERPHQSTTTCRDCLAIPLVAVMGSKQVNGFIIPPIRRRTSVNVNENGERMTSYENQANKQTSGYDSLQFAQHLKNYYQKEHDSFHNHRRFEPQSDENCPMTGTLTVCDQISSYPADIILNKLDSAKKVLKQSYFNIDSLFSDERDHSSEPFEDLMSSNNVFGKGKRLKSTSMTVDNSRTLKFESGGEKVGQKKEGKRDYASSTRDSYDQNHDHDNHSYRQSRAITSSPFQGILNSEDFVDLVERRAFSLSMARSPKQRRQLPLLQQDEVGKRSVVAITAQTGKQDKQNTHTRANGYLSSNGRGENWRHFSDPALISNDTTLANRLLSMSRQTTNTTTTTTTTTTSPDTKTNTNTNTGTGKDQASHETQKQLLKTFGEGDEEQEEEDGEDEATYQPSTASSSVEENDLSGFSSTRKVLKSATIQARTTHTIPKGRQLNSNSKYPNNKFNPHKRSRRQASAQVAGSSGVNGNGDTEVSLPAVGISPSEGSQVDPDSVTNSVRSSFGETGINNQQMPEPICRAKSIYISPRAAVSINFLLQQQL